MEKVELKIMDSNIILEFLEIYKNLDELCKQILSSDRGVSQYIDEMDNERQGYRIAGWKDDYKTLKHLRWIRNRLVHEANSFKDNIVRPEDIQWLHTFYRRIMEHTDPFSLLQQSKNGIRKTEKGSNSHISTTNKYSTRKEDMGAGYIILIAIILAGVVLLGILYILSLFCL